MNDFWYIFLIWILALVSPGPDFVVVATQASQKGRKVGLFTAIGVALGVLFHCVYSILGVGIIISNSPAFFTVLKVTGGLYLIYLGFQSFVSKNKKQNQQTNKTDKLENPLNSVKIGFLTDALSPKTSIFIITLFTQSSTFNTNLSIQLIHLMMFTISTVIWHSTVVLVLSSKRPQELYFKFSGVINRVFGVILILFGIEFLFNL